jgi:hypothetical protein
MSVRKDLAPYTSTGVRVHAYVIPVYNIEAYGQMEVYFHSFLTPPVERQASANLPRSAGHNAPIHLLSGRVGGLDSWSGHFGDEVNLLLLPAIKPRFLGCPTRNLFAKPAKTYPMTDEPMARMPKMASGKITLARGIYCCPKFFFILLLDQNLYIVKNACINTHN